MNPDEDEFSDEEESGAFDDRRPLQDADRDFDDDLERSGDGYGPGGDTMVTNQPFDEAVELSDHGSEQPSPLAKAERGGAPVFVPPPEPGAVVNQPHDEEFDVESEGSVDEDEEDEHSLDEPPPPSKAMQKQQHQQEEMEEAPRYERRPEAPTLGSLEQPQMGEMASSPGGGMMGSVHRDFPALGSPGSDDEGELGSSGPVAEGMYDANECAISHAGFRLLSPPPPPCPNANAPQD